MAKSVASVGSALGVIGAVMTLACATNTARGDILREFTITATNDDGPSSYSWTCPDPNATDWVYDNPNTWTMRSSTTGNPVATVMGLHLEIHGDPQANLSFNVQAGASATSFTITTALVNFPTITNGVANASAAITLTDGNANGIATLTGNLGPSGGFAYQADYNGYVPGGTNYALFVPSFGAPSFTGSGAAGPTVLSGNQTDMSAMFAFTLSPRDLASGTSTYEIVPSPAGVALLGVGGLATARRRRR
jgi:hypothetical protein